MSENLGWVCQLADSEAYRFSRTEDLNNARAAISAVRAEFAELERKAEALDMVISEVTRTIRVLSVERVMLKATEYDRGGEAMCKSIVQLINSLAKGGRDADDVP